MQMVLGAIVGAVFLAFGVAIFLLVSAMRDANMSLKQCVAVFAGASRMSSMMEEQVAATKRLISAVERNAATTAEFNRIVLRSAETPPETPNFPPPPPPEFGGRIPRGVPPRPPVPSYDKFATDGESDTIATDDEDLAKAAEIADMVDRGLVPLYEEGIPLPGENPSVWREAGVEEK